MAEMLEVGEEEARQYIDARQTFVALEQARVKALEYRGSMRWKRAKGRDYLARVSPRGSQHGLGVRSAQTEAIYTKFTDGKARAQALRCGLEKTMQRHQRVNKAVRVGHVPNTIVSIIAGLNDSGMGSMFTVIGTNALYAYEATAGVRFSGGLMATKDFDLLWDSRRKLSLAVREGPLADGMLAYLRRIDPTFTLLDEQRYTAVNKDGLEVDILRRLGTGPDQITRSTDDFWVVQARNADWLLSAPRFSEIVVAANGRMARMTTVDPRAFALFKLWMSRQADREPTKKARDLAQALCVIELVNERLPHLSFEAVHVFPSVLVNEVRSLGKASRPR